jgi:hypothetical protein
MRSDRHNANLKKGIVHKCDFAKTTVTLPDLLPAEDSPKSELWDCVAHFVGTHNIALQTAASPDFRNLLEFTFREGYREGSRPGARSVEASFKASCPIQKATALRRRIVRVASKDRDYHLSALSTSPFCGLSMDAGQIGPVKLFVINLMATNIPLCFTENILKIATVNCVIVREILVNTIHTLSQKSIRVSGVLCDGARYQVKALDFEDPESVQCSAEEPLLNRLLYIPCLCHRLNNAYQTLFRECAPFQAFLIDLRTIGKTCRKPANRRHFNRLCPEFVETRWLYDHRILTFVITNVEAINALGLPECQVSPLFRECSPLLGTFFHLMTQLESSKTPLGQAYPLILDCIETLERYAAESQRTLIDEDNAISVMYTHAGQVIRRFTLESTYNLLQLAHILSPRGHASAKRQLRQPDVFAHDDEHPVEESLLLDDFLPQLADHENGETDETSDDEGEIPIEIEEEDGVEAPEVGEPISTEHAVWVEVRELHSCTNLVARARQGLGRIAAQFRLNPDQQAALAQAFDAFLADRERNLHLNTSLDGERFLWEVTPAYHPGVVLLSEIALRLEPLPCSEAASERAIGQQRRHLAPHRMRTNTDLLLARTQMEDGSQTRSDR